MEIKFQNLTINDSEKLCYIDKEIIKLTKTEYNILFLLLNNQNKVFSRQEIIDSIYSGNVNEKAINTMISRLRKKLKEYGKYIETRLGFGYVFNSK
jgi:DNA-binding response OmpR family regulator